MHILPKGFVKAPVTAASATNTEPLIFSDVVSCWTSSRQGKPKQSCRAKPNRNHCSLNSSDLGWPVLIASRPCTVLSPPSTQLVGHHEQHSPSALVSTVLMNILPAPNFRLDDAQLCPAAHSSQPQPIRPIGIVTVDENRSRIEHPNKLKSFRSSGNLSLDILRVIESANALHAKSAQHNGQSIRLLPSRIDCNSYPADGTPISDSL